jgi:hypothetical protein
VPCTRAPLWCGGVTLEVKEYSHALTHTHLTRPVCK